MKNKIVSYRLNIVDNLVINYESIDDINITPQNLAKKITLLNMKAFNHPAENYNPSYIQRESNMHLKALKKNRYIIATDKNGVIGFAKLSLKRKNISLLAVSQTKRQQHVGSNLLKSSIKWFYRNNISSFNILSTHQSNGFYSKFFKQNRSMIIGNQRIAFKAANRTKTNGSKLFSVTFNKQ